MHRRQRFRRISLRSALLVSAFAGGRSTRTFRPGPVRFVRILEFQRLGLGVLVNAAVNPLCMFVAFVKRRTWGFDGSLGVVSKLSPGEDGHPAFGPP